MNDHAPKLAALEALHRGLLSANGQQAIEKHLARCDVCRRALATIELYAQTTREVRGTEPSLDWNRLVERIDAEMAVRRAARRQRTLRALAAVTASVGVAAAIWLLLPQRHDEPPRAPRYEAVAKTQPPAPPVHAWFAEPTLIGGTPRVTDGWNAPAPVNAPIAESAVLALNDTLRAGARVSTDPSAEAHLALRRSEERLAPGSGRDEATKWSGPTRLLPSAAGLAILRGSDMSIGALDDERFEFSLASGRVVASIQGGEPPPGSPAMGEAGRPGSFLLETQFIVLAGEYRMRAQTALFEVDLEDERVALEVASGRVELELPDGTLQVIEAPGSWSSDGTAGNRTVRAPHAIPGDDSPVVPVSFSHPRVFEWDYGEGMVLGAGSLQMQIRPGPLTISGFDSQRVFRTTVEVGESGLALGPTDLVAETPRPRQGLLPQSEIERVIRRGIRPLQRCYEHGLRVQPNLEGHLTARITIGLDGAVSRSSLLGEHVPRSLEECVQTQVQRWSFPPPVGGTLTFDLPLTFAAR